MATRQKLPEGRSPGLGGRQSPPLGALMDRPQSSQSVNPDAAIFLTEGNQVRLEKRVWPAASPRGPLICEKGFTNTLRGLGTEIGNLLTKDMEHGMLLLSKDMTDKMQQLADAREKTVKSILVEVAETHERIQREAARIECDFFKPVLEEVRKLSDLDGDRERHLDRKLSLNFSKLVDEIHIAQRALDTSQSSQLAQFRQDFGNVHQDVLEQQQVIQRMQSELARVSSEQQSLIANTTSTVQEVQKIHQEIKRNQTDVDLMGHRMDAHLAQAALDHQAASAASADYMKEIHRLHEENERRQSDFILEGLENQFNASRQEQVEQLTKMEGNVAKVQKDVKYKFSQVLGEIGRVQQALNLEYVPDPSTVIAYADKRLREFWSQTEAPQRSDGGCQTDAVKEQHAHKEKSKIEVKKKKRPPPRKEPAPAAVVFADADSMKKKMRKQIANPENNLFNLYHSEGFCQHIAKSVYFENATFLVIFLNAIWIAVDTDHNNAALLIEADPVFIVAENMFCLYFFVELIIRFLAFKKKRYIIKDPWFLFDLVMVSSMVVETWIVTIALLFMEERGGSLGLGNFSILRLARLAKMCRVARMARFLRAVPELLVLVKGIGAAARSVFFVSLLVVVIIYVYAVGLRQLTKDTAVGDEWFRSVPVAMNSLLLYGVLPDQAEIIQSVSEPEPFLWPFVMFFVLLASITVMYMLLGVMVEVVRTVAATEKERVMVQCLSSQLREVLNQFKNGPVVGKGSLPIFARDETDDADLSLSKEEYEEFLNEMEASRVISQAGVMVDSLLDQKDTIFEDLDGRRLSFEDLVGLILEMRSTNPATVQDMRGQNRSIQKLVKEATNFMMASMREEFKYIRDSLESLDGVGDMVKTTNDHALDDGSEDDSSGNGDAFQSSHKDRRDSSSSSMKRGVTRVGVELE